MKNWLWRITGALEEIRKLRVKVEYQQRWIDSRMNQEKTPPESHDRNALRVMQRRAGRLLSAHPEIYKEFFSKEAAK